MTAPKPDTAKANMKAIVEHLTKRYGFDPAKARKWARYLRGMEWRWVRPVVQMAAAAHHDHPAAVLGLAAAASEDAEFKAAVKKVIERS